MNKPNVNSQRKQLRQQLRQRRRALSPQQQQQACQQIARLVGRDPRFIRAKHIAFYLANDGEIDPSLLLERALQMGKHCYLPVIVGKNQLCFVRYRRGDVLIKNRFGIAEPKNCYRQRCTKTMDLVLMPLVGFDRCGGRLGMGGGFYDRSFNWLQSQPLLRKPDLLGLAHACQEVESLTLAKWDIPLGAITTDKEIIVVYPSNN